LADPARASNAASLRRDAVLEAVAFAAERLLRSTDWRAVADEALARLGVAADVSRACVMENELDPEGRLLVRVVAEWTAPGVTPQIDTDLFDRFEWEPNFGRWVAEMRSGRAVVGTVATFPKPERPALLAQDVVSLAYFPIEIDGWWWGCVGFDAVAEDRDWSSADLDGLRTAAALIAAAISRQKREQQTRGAERRSQSVVENIPAVTYVDVVGDDGRARLAFLSPQIETLLGHPSEQFLADPDFWFELIHPDDRARVEKAGRNTSATGALFDEEYRMRTADGHLAIAKFPNKGDEVNPVVWEALALTLAEKAGIPVPQWRLESVADKPVLLLRRFDRENGARIPFLSAMSMLDARDNETRSYLEFVDALRQHGASPQDDMHALWRRIVFSILISNTDDHLRNHGFLWAGPAGWRLSPAYDLNPVPVDIKPRVLTTAINQDDGKASLKLAYEVAPYFELEEDEARRIVREAGNAVASWRKVAAGLGLGKNEIDRMASAFEHDDLKQALAEK
jgi:PAS domain-containing protein